MLSSINFKKKIKEKKIEKSIETFNFLMSQIKYGRLDRNSEHYKRMTDFQKTLLEVSYSFKNINLNRH